MDFIFATSLLKGKVFPKINVHMYVGQHLASMLTILNDYV
jgi:hypothetical protein